MDKVKQGNFLALCLLDALEDGNEKTSVDFLVNHRTNPNHIVFDKGIAPIHYACGMENIDVANKIVKLMLELNGDPNLPTVDDKMTPLHITAMCGRTHIFEMLLTKGGNVNQPDILNRIPIHYAIFEEQFDIVKMIQNHMQNKKPENSVSVPNKNSYNNNIIRETPQIDKGITCLSEPIEQNTIFSLTKENLSELSKRMSPKRSTKSIVATWREKVEKSKNMSSIQATYDNIDALLSAYMTDLHLNFSNTHLNDTNVESEYRFGHFFMF